MTTGASPAGDPLPAPRRSGAAYRIALVCLGNICRSPIAETVLRDRLEQAGLAEDVEVGSFGTGGWHVGRPMDTRAAAVLADHGYDGSGHRARRFEPASLQEHDLVLAMDGLNHAELTSLAETRDDLARVRLFRDFDPAAEDGLHDVPDPYYGGNRGFLDVLAIVERTVGALVAALTAATRADSPRSAGVAPAQIPPGETPSRSTSTAPAAPAAPMTATEAG